MKTILFNMLRELDNYKHDKSVLMQQYVAERLDKSYTTYEQELMHSLEFLTRKHEKSLVKRIKNIDDKLN